MNFKEYKLLSVKVPKGILSSPMLFEGVLAYMHSVKDGNVIEFVYSNNFLHFLIHVPFYAFDSICTQLYSVYPDCVLEEVAYLDSLDLKAKKYLLIKFGLKNSSVFPLKRYEQFEDRLTKVVFDPLNSLFEFLGSSFKAQVRFGLFLKPEAHSFKFYASKALYYLNSFESFFVFPFLKSFFLKLFLSRNFITRLIFAPFYLSANAASKEFSLDDEVKKEHKIETSLEAAIDKINKTLFDVSIKCLVSFDHDLDFKAYIHSIEAVLKTYEQANLNGFKVVSYELGDYKLLKKYFYFKDSFVLNSEEIATVFHAPGENVVSNSYTWINSKKLAPPICESGICLGLSDYRSLKTVICLSEKDRLRHTYIIGKTGMGKSTLMLNCMLQDAVQGNGFALIDPHGDLVDAFLSRIPPSRINDVVLIEPFMNKYSIGLNLLETYEGVDLNIVTSSVVAIFKKLFGYSWGPRLEYFLRNFIQALVTLKEGFTLLDLYKMLIDLDYCNDIVKKLKDPVLKSFFEKEYFKLNQKQQSEFLAPILNKLGQFTMNPKIRNIISHSVSTIDFGLCMSKKQIVIINLAKGKLGEDSSSLLGSMFVSKFEIEAMRRAKIDETMRVPFYLYIDEFQNFATDSFATILSEARKYGLGLVLANQFLGQMPDEVYKSIFGNIGNLIAFQVGADDADFLSRQFLEQVSASDILQLEKYQAYGRILVNGQSSSAFSFRTLSPKASNRQYIKNLESIRKQNKSRFTKKNKISMT